IPGAEGKQILLDVRYNPSRFRQKIVVFAHGYKGFKDWGQWNDVADAFVEQGFCFIKFNFSHNGVTSSNLLDITDLESFGRNTYSKELFDIQAVFDWILSTQELPDGVVTKSGLSLIGHSRGGAIAILHAARDHRVDKLVTWGAVSDFRSRFPFGLELERWKKEGVFYALNARTRALLPHYLDFLEDFEQNEERLNIKTAAKSLVCPHLIVHGNDDEAVHVSDAFKIHRWSGKSRLELVEQTGHTFGMGYPLMNAAKQAELINRTVAFLTQEI
ncbi:MAG: hypothetical protein RL226_764, partial [Bacteroidota bacterium]